MSALKTLAKKAAALVVKKVTTIGPDGEEVTRTKAREGVKGAGWITGFLLLWHFILQPVLAHHFPQYSFPALDFSWLTGLFLGL